MNTPAKPFPKPTAQVAPYFDVLGPELTVTFLMTFGGAAICLSKNPRENSRVAAVIGHEKAKELAEISYLLPRRVPLANKWLAGMMQWQGYSGQEIARRMHVSDYTVSVWLRPKEKSK